MAVDANRIKQLRKKAGLTQEELGKKIGVIKQTVSSWENNISEPNSEILSNMASIFDVSVDYLLGREDCLAQKSDEWKLGEQLKSLRELKKKSQQEVCSILNIEQGALANYEGNKRMPKFDTLIKLADYYNVSIDYLLGREDSSGQGLDKGDIVERGLDGDGITHMLRYPEAEEKAVSFSNKLALQIDYTGSRLADVASAISVPIEFVLEWLYGKRNDYPQYYEKLSEYFNVDITYWTRPGAVSPGIEPTTDECLLIIKYRRQKHPKEIEYAPPIECFFPNCRELSESELEWLESFRCSELSGLWVEWLETFKTLSKDDKYILLGEAKKLIKEQQRSSVAADPMPLKKTGTDRLGK